MKQGRTLARSKHRRRKRRTAALTLDSLASDTLRLVAWAFLHCGYSPLAIVNQFTSYAQAPPRSLLAQQRSVRGDLHDPDHVLTLWLTDPEYVDAQGRPRPLRVWGPAPSIEALVKRVSPTLGVEGTLEHLLVNGVIRRRGQQYIQTSDVVRYRRRSKNIGAHHMLVLNELVRTFQYNAKSDSVKWPQFMAECPNFPAAELAAYTEAFRKRMLSFLLSEDKLMARTALQAAPRARRVRSAVSMFFSVAPSDCSKNLPDRTRKRSNRETSSSARR